MTTCTPIGSCAGCQVSPASVETATTPCNSEIGTTLPAFWGMVTPDAQHSAMLGHETLDSSPPGKPFPATSVRLRPPSLERTTAPPASVPQPGPPLAAARQSVASAHVTDWRGALPDGTLACCHVATPPVL